MFVLGGIVLLLGCSCLVVEGTCEVDGVVYSQWDEWEEGCHLCICVDENKTDCQDVCNPCYKYSESGDSCKELGCYDNWSDPAGDVPDANLPKVPLGDVFHWDSTTSCTCVDGYRYVLCMAS